MVGEPDLELWVAEIRLRARRRIGELSAALESGQGANQHRSSDGTKLEALQAAGHLAHLIALLRRGPSERHSLPPAALEAAANQHARRSGATSKRETLAAGVSKDEAHPSATARSGAKSKNEVRRNLPNVPAVERTAKAEALQAAGITSEAHRCDEVQARGARCRRHQQGRGAPLRADRPRRFAFRPRNASPVTPAGTPWWPLGSARQTGRAPDTPGRDRGSTPRLAPKC
jgi:hypothetical protein